MTADDCSPEDLANLLGISTRTLTDLAKRGHVVKAKRGRYRLAASVTAYCGHLRGVAAGRGGDDQVAALTSERARLAREQADAAALKNAVTRGSMIAASDVEREWCDVLRFIRAGILTLPGRMEMRLPHLGKSDMANIQLEVRNLLSELGRSQNE